MKDESPAVTHKPNEFYERLIMLRETNPAAFARFDGRTHERLQAYEAARRSADGRPEEGDGSYTRLG